MHVRANPAPRVVGLVGDNGPIKAGAVQLVETTQCTRAHVGDVCRRCVKVCLVQHHVPPTSPERACINCVIGVNLSYTKFKIAPPDANIESSLVWDTSRKKLAINEVLN